MGEMAKPPMNDIFVVKPVHTQIFNIDNPFPNFNDGNFFAILYYVLLSAMTIKQDTVLSQSKQLIANANMQNRLNKENASIKFSAIPDPSKAGSKTVQAVDQQNQIYAAEREDIQSMLITARQNAEVLMTQASTNVNILQQDASQDSAWLQTLNAIFQLINQMTQR